MPRTKRTQSEADIYHVMVRGEGRRIIFEDDEDRETFLRVLQTACERYGGEVYAWCLMSNHAHLLLHVPFGRLPRMMQSLTSGYAVYYNKRHNHVGHVFAGRYTSEAINDDEYLIAAIRYIHFNPVKGGLSRTCEYPWSSYREYRAGGGVASTAFVLEVIGGIDAFMAVHERDEDASSDLLAQYAPGTMGSRPRMSDAQALSVARDLLGDKPLQNLANAEKAQRNQGIAMLRRAGLSTRQVERFTGIGRGVIDRVRWKS